MESEQNILQKSSVRVYHLKIKIQYQTIHFV